MQEMIQARFINTNESQLYVCRHSPAVKADSSKTIIVCNAFGHEYERSHRALRQLAVQLARAGHNTFRFDYTGTGDSSGDSSDSSIEEWKKDLNTLIQDARQVTGCSEVVLAGMRLGATIAAQVAAQRDDIKALVLYSPVLNHKTMLDEWQREHKKFFRKHSHAKNIETLNEMLGYPVTERFRDEMEQGLYLPKNIPGTDKILMLYDSDDKSTCAEAEKHLQGAGADISTETYDDIAIWKREPFDAMVPFKLIRRIVNWIGET